MFGAVRTRFWWCAFSIAAAEAFEANAEGEASDEDEEDEAELVAAAAAAAIAAALIGDVRKEFGRMFMMGEKTSRGEREKGMTRMSVCVCVCHTDTRDATREQKQNEILSRQKGIVSHGID